MTQRLSNLGGLPDSVCQPGYEPTAHGVGIVHLGLGAFHKAHQAAYTDAALGLRGGDWRIAGVSLRSAEPAAQLNPQNGLFTLIERSAQGSRARIMASIAKALCLHTDRADVTAALAAPETRIVTLTVTEKGYGIDRATGSVDPTHAAIAHDLADPQNPVGVAGLLVQALGARRTAGVAPFTVLCCDNLPENGPAIRGLLLDFARRAAPHLLDHISAEVAFPATMVDRITPAATDDTRRAAAKMTGRHDAAAVETEAFSQWVIEDRFPTGRPGWESAGALMVDDVRAYEKMKLRMLNGTHSMLAYAGFVVGLETVADVMLDPDLSRLVRRHLDAAARSLSPLVGVDYDAYADALAERFANPHLRHKTYQIAMDGTEKLPQRIFAPAAEALFSGQDLSAFAFATAAWIRYMLCKTEAGSTYALQDPKQDAIAEAVRHATTAEALVSNIMALPGVFPEVLTTDMTWRSALTEKLHLMLVEEMHSAIRAEASSVTS